MRCNTVLFIVFLVQVFSSWSLTVRWIGLTGNPSWTVSDNWYCGALNRSCVPQSVDDVVIQPSGSCSQCIRNIVILSNTSAICNTLTVVADGSPVSLSIQSSSLTIGATAQFGLGSTLYVQQATVSLVNSNAKFSSDDTVVIDGGTFSGSSFKFSNVNISSAAVLYNATIQNLQFTPYLPNLDCSLGGGQIIVNGKSFAYSSVIVQNVNLGQFTYKPLNPNYTLDFQGNVQASELHLYGGMITYQIGTGTFGNITLYGGVTFTILAASITSSSVSGSGTIYINNNDATFKSDVNNIVTDFYVSCGVLEIGGNTVGNIYLGYECGYPYLYLNTDGMTVNNITSSYQTTIQCTGQLYVNYLSLENLALNNCQLNLIGSLQATVDNYVYITMQNANFSIGSREFQQGKYYLTIDGSGTVINNGVWICSYVLTTNVPTIGTGKWLINSDATVSLYVVNTVLSSVVLDQGQLYLYGFNCVINYLMGGNTSGIRIYGSPFTFNNISIPSIFDYSTNGLVFNNFIIGYYYGGTSNQLTFVSGTGEYIGVAPSSTINLKAGVKLMTLDGADQDLINSEMIAPLSRFSFTGGILNHTGNAGVLQVTTATTFVGDSTKSFGPNTVLQTPSLTCQCPTPDCGITITEWNHVQAGQTSGCII